MSAVRERAAEPGRRFEPDERLEPIVLEAAPGAPAKAPVRIFLGTEPSQHRAERIFVYALQLRRDPARRYEIHRMTRLSGFDTAGWRTGFTNYRFAVADLAGRHGRAIYNDVDQLWFGDPAELFDQPMGEHGYLALSPQDTAVMLLDCARMAEVWTLDGARTTRKKALHTRAATAPGLWGPLDPQWHARDLEFRPGVSKLLHFTTLHLQPWRPMPEQYTYEMNAFGEYFLGLEDAADAAGFELYSETKPSPACAAARERGAVCGLDDAPPEDLPWLVDRSFAQGGREVRVEARIRNDDSLAGSASGWRRLMRRVARRYPGSSWQLDLLDANGRRQSFRADPAAVAAAAPRVWVLLGSHGGDNAQLIAIAEALGGPWERKEARFERAAFRWNRLLGGWLSSRAVPGLEAPWPDLVLSAGRRTVPVARWIRSRSGGRTRIVHIGRSRSPQSAFDLVLVTPQYGMPLHDNVVDLPAPFVAASADPPGLELWRERFAALPKPWIGVLAGGSATPFWLDAATATELGRQASAAAQARGGSLLVSTSPRTGKAASDALLAAIDAPHFAHRYGAGADNPYPAILALADAFVVTGESATMIAEACLRGRPVCVFPLPIRRDRLKVRWRHSLECWAGVVERQKSSRGAEQQQTWRGRLYLALIGAGWRRRERQYGLVHAALGLQSLPDGLDRPSDARQLLESSRRRAIAAVRALLTSERAVISLKPGERSL